MCAAHGGLEVLQFAYFSRRHGAVIGPDVIDEMMAACHRNLAEAEEVNAWFKQSYVDLRKGDALSLSIADASIDVAAQNCPFNIFYDDDQRQALAEMNRVSCWIVSKSARSNRPSSQMVRRSGPARRLSTLGPILHSATATASICRATSRFRFLCARREVERARSSRHLRFQADPVACPGRWPLLS
jgi:Methyltransferase domain